MRFKGIVCKGQGKGHQTGLKTANLNVKLAKNLNKGVYSCQVELNHKKYKGLLYYGYNSLTKTNCLEVYILNFNQNIYNQTISVITKNFLRLPKKFNSIKSLAKQLKKDIVEL